MNSALFRLLLACLLTIAIPVQGFAALGTSRNAPCGMSTMEMGMMADAMANDIADDIADDTPAHSGMPDKATHGKQPGACPHCANHCASMNLATFTSPPRLAIYESGARANFPPLIQPLPNAPVHLPERPPKA